MANENRELAEFAENLWMNYIQPKMKRMLSDSVTYYKAEVKRNTGTGTATVQSVLDTERTVSCSRHMRDVAVGTQVLVMRFGNGNAKNHLIVATAGGDSRIPAVKYKDVTFTQTSSDTYIISENGIKIISAALVNSTGTGGTDCCSGLEFNSDGATIHFNNALTSGTVRYWYIEED